MTKKKIITISIAVFVFIILNIIPSISNIFNSNLEKSFYSIHGESKPDSNIILIHIAANDIENLGEWPLKRSYYALLIDNLTRLKVKKIGMEIFLSENIASQNIYNIVLNESIRKSGKVVLASLADDLTKKNEIFYTKNILYPSPMSEVQDVLTGHINFVSKNGILIPSQINTNSSSELSFSRRLSEINIDTSNIKVNFVSSWQSFTNFSLLDFFGMVENDDSRLTNFKDKIILIGVSDLLIAKSVNSHFDSELPGLGLHAFAIDNILNNRILNHHFISISRYVFLILIILLAYIQLRNFLLVSFSIFMLLLLFVLWQTYQLQLDYAAFLLPISFFIVYNFFHSIKQRKIKLDETLNETTTLQRKLRIKEEKLEQLKTQLASEESSSFDGLELTIREMKKEIDKLKSVEQDDKKEYTKSIEAKIFEGIVYRSNKMDKIIEVIKKVAPQNASVLVMGESGSGKELVANAIHNLSERRKNNFVAVNCAALPDNLLESELFGHVKGAFTGAVSDKIGRFEEANNGTLFLDEIGETSENFQVKLLRVLQTGDFQKVGSSKTDKVDVRIVAATNKKLIELVKAKKFREDLFYRLNVINIELPYLRERKEDIELLAEYFAKREGEDFTFSKAVMNRLIENEWKGNIRELESTIRRSIIFAKSESRTLIKLKDLPEELSKIEKSELENLILESLREKKFSHSSINETAKELGNFNRTVISENFRGLLFRSYSQNDFNVGLAVADISSSDDNKIKEKVESKLNKFLSNIENDVRKHSDKSFEEVKHLLNSKYKNLPQKYHVYLDLVIKKLMQTA